MSDRSASPRPPQPSASLVLLRQGATMEVLVGLRGLHVRAFPGATAFPGGKLDPQDAAWPEAESDPLRRAGYAALRETFEETGLLLTATGEGPPAALDVDAARATVELRQVSFRDLLIGWDRRVSPDRLTPFAQWVTPEAAPYRFATTFFLVEASAYEANASLICAEFERLRWESPARLLAEEGLQLLTPTRHCLEVLTRSRSAAEAVEAARTRGLIDGEQVRASQPRAAI